MEITMPLIWIIAAIIFAVIEVVTPQFVTLWFAAGAIVTMITAFFDIPVGYQLVIFVASSTVFLLITRPLYRKFVKSKHEPTNADTLIGETAIVTQTIDNDDAQGLVKVKGQVWSAKSSDGKNVAEGEKVKIVKIEGVKLVVETKS